MNRLVASMLLLALSQTAWAQDEAERERIRSERARIEAAFAEQEKACYSRFAVNDCIDDARARRRAGLADLRRQEVSLNDQERKRKADERLREVQERQAEQARRQQAAPAPAPASVPPPAARPAPRPQPATPRQPDAPPAPDTRENLRRHQERLEEAQERKGRVEQRAAERNKPSRPLPVPP